MERLRGALAIALLVPAALIGIPLQWLALKLGSGAAHRIPVWFHRWVNRVVGIRREVSGAPAAERPLLLVSNHTSWLDITVLSAVLPVSFVAKSEVAGWPIFGLFARLQRSIFVDRGRRTGTAAVNAEMAERLTSGDAIVLFAEGTSSEGSRVLPFRTALLGATRAAATAAGIGAVWVQPVAITYVGWSGMPIGRPWRPRVAWYGGMDLAPHLWDILKHGGIDVVVAFGAPVLTRGEDDRKQLALALESEVRRMNRDAVLGLRPVARRRPA